MIGGLQGEFGDLDIKYLKQNIPKYRLKISQDVSRKYLKMLVENIWKLQENTAALCNILPSAWSDPGNLKCRPWMLSR